MAEAGIVCSEGMTRFECGERFLRFWQHDSSPASSHKNPIVLGIVHGLGDHSGRFDEMARWFAEQGLLVYAFDLLAHGKSPGERAANHGYESLLQDVEGFFNYLSNRHPGSLVGMFGQSMGGNLVLNHQLRGFSQSAFIIAGSPMLRIAYQPDAASLFAIRLLSFMFPKFKIAGEHDPAHLSRDPEMQRRYAEDPLVQRGITLRLARELIDSGLWAIKVAGRLNTPTLLTHGTADRITCHKASSEFAQTSAGRAIAKLWPEGKHDLHHDIVRHEYFASLLEWIYSVADKPVA